VQSFARLLTQLGHEVHVFATHYPGYEDPADYPVHRYPGILTPIEQGYNIAVPFWPAMIKIMRQSKLQIIHTQSPFLLGVAGARWAKYLGIPLVTTNHTLYTEYVHYSPFPPLVSKVSVVAWVRVYCNRADEVIVPTEPIRDVLRGYGVTKPISALSTGIDLRRIRSADPTGLRRKYSIPQKAELIVFVGRLVKEKNVDVLLESFRLIAEHRPMAYLLIVGGGPEECALRKKAREYGLTRRIRFAGWQSPDERNGHLRAGDLFLYPSVSDTQGLVLCEAMAAGLPCVAADAFGSSAVVRHGVDGLLTPDAADAQAKAVTRLLSQPERLKEMSYNAFHGAERFSEEIAVQNLLRIYDSALSRPPRPRSLFMHNLSNLSG
jgi:glycosyltransferase involved in cell wall biosynthesis